MAVLLKNTWKIEHEMEAGEKSSLLDALLAARGCRFDEQKDWFLSPPLDILHDPFLLNDMTRACDIVAETLAAREKIIVFGDYDADGITSTSILYLFLKEKGADAEFLIPDRILEGYGLTEPCVQKILDRQARLVVTVDCGIASVKEVRQLTEKGIRVVITDHHECKSELPDAGAVINPKRPDSRYPFRDLAGAGVVLKLIQALCIRMEWDSYWKTFIDLAAIGTVADVVPLYGENRMIVYHGLAKINRSANAGLKSLLKEIDKSDKTVTSGTIGYAVAPRINAAGRMGDSNRAVRLFTTDDEKEASALAFDLAADNRRRQEIEMQIFETAKERIQSEYDFSSKDIIVVYQKGWHQGVIGIVASKLTELYHRSVIIFGGEEGFYKGSARSAGEESILEAIEFAGAHVAQFGGHQKAAGLIVEDGQMDAFLESVREYSRRRLSAAVEEDTLRIDYEIPYGEITLSNAIDIARMAPYGEGNPQPIFVCRNLTVDQVRFLSSGKHLKMNLISADKPSWSGVEAIAFGFPEKNPAPVPGDAVDVAFSLELNEWNGRMSAEINVKDLQKACTDLQTRWNQLEEFYRSRPGDILSYLRAAAIPPQDAIPQRADFIAVYQYLKTTYAAEPVLCDLDLLSERIAGHYQISLTVFKLARIFDIFMDVNVIRYTALGKYRVQFQLLEVFSKVSLANSKTYKALCTESVVS